MYSASNVAVDKGLGMDFSGIADMVKAALPVGLNIYQNQMQLKQVKAISQSGFMQQVPTYGLPLSQAMQPQPTFGGQYAQPSSGMSTGTMVLAGVGLIGVLLAAKMLLK